MSTDSLIVVGNGFIGNYLAWNVPSNKTFALTRNFKQEILDLPLSESYIIVWAHGESRGPTIRESQLGTLTECVNSIKDRGLKIRKHIYISSTKVCEDPDSEFSKVKRECENYILSLDSSVQVLRTPNVYGTFSSVKPNSILSRWMLDSESIVATPAVREFVSLRALSSFIRDEVWDHNQALINTVRGVPCVMSEIGEHLARLRDVNFKPFEGLALSGGFVPEDSHGDVYLGCGFDIFSELGNHQKSSEYASSLLSRVQQSERFHRRPDSDHFLQDLDSEVLDGLKRVYVFNILGGHMRGGHYHREQTEVFYVLNGECEIKLEQGGCSGVITLAQGQYIKVLPFEQHTFWAKNSDVQILAVSDFAYIPNSVPDTFEY